MMLQSFRMAVFTLFSVSSLCDFMMCVMSRADHRPQFEAQVLGDFSPAFTGGAHTFDLVERIAQGRIGFGVCGSELLSHRESDRDFAPALALAAQILDRRVGHVELFGET